MNEVNVTYQSSRIDHTRKKFNGLELPDLKGKRFLDLGCNSGAFCQFADELGASQVAGIDIDSRLIDIAREQLPNGIFAVSKFEDMHLNGEKFDVVTIASAIHYSQNFLVVADRIMDLLSPGGLLVIEGGLFDPAGNTALNTPVPGWRKIGDHCRQLSLGFARDVMFPTCTVKLIGSSLNQGGDNQARYVLHVTNPERKNVPMPKKVPARLDLEAFIRSLAVSYDTIADKYPLSKHMEALKIAALMGPGKYDEHLTGRDLPELIAKEIQYCTDDWASRVEIVDLCNTTIGHELAIALSAPRH